jgi:diguanylate cyclase (GGDEF)-like protein
MTKIKTGIFLFLLAFCCLFGGHAQAAENGARVLFISSYSYAWEQVQLQIAGIQAGLGENDTLDYEFMDTKRVDDETSWQLFYEGIAYRLANVEPYDAVILGDDAALKFAMTYREELFDGIPLVFEGVSDESLAREAAEDPLITGILEAPSVAENIELGLKINPKAKKVVAVLDDTLTGQAERRNFYKYEDQFPDLEFSEINASELTTLQLHMAIKNVSSDSIFLYIILSEDASGKRYTNSEAISITTSLAQVPVMRMVEGGIEEGLLGGYMVSMQKAGEMAAGMAKDFIDGTDVYGDTIADMSNIYCINDDVLRKFGISRSIFPEDTIYVNYQENFFERNKEALVPAGILIGTLVLILILAVIDNYRRRKLMRELEDAKKIVETASEHDFLTGIPNRSRFMNDLQVLIGNEIPCTVMMIDIDDFKNINDSFGHKAGDDALRQVAGRLKEMQSPILMPYRFAGDEFILILQSSQKKIVEKTAYQCRQVFAKPFELGGRLKKVCGSIGVSSYPDDTRDMEQLIIYADDAMYRVKKSGKNDFAFYHDTQPG